MKFIGLTGGVGAGKTTVLKQLKRLTRSRILIADEIAHELMEPGCDCYRRIRESFQEEDIWLSDGSINRQALAARLFSDREKRELLNSIVHPAVKRYILGEVERERQAGGYDYVILEAALLIEEHYDELCDELWYVYASPATRKKRLMADRGYTEQKVDQILAAQLPDETYRKFCKRIINNDGDEIHLEQEIRKNI
jgi:dephospho-CoA kinase